MVAPLYTYFPFTEDTIAKDHSYLDSAATTQKPTKVIAALSAAYSKGLGNPDRGLHYFADQTARAIQEARSVVAHFIGSKEGSQQIVFNSGTTAGINQVAWGFLAPKLKDGDVVWATVMDHHSNLLPWKQLCEQKGAQLKLIPLTEEGVVDLQFLATNICSKSRLIALPHLSNLLGTLNPIAEVAQIAKAYKVPLLVDAAQSVGHMPLAVDRWGCDFLVFSAHKMYGPTGVGVLYIAPQWRESFIPLYVGGGIIAAPLKSPSCSITYVDAPYYLEAGTLPLAGIIGLTAAISFIREIGWKRIMQEEEQWLMSAQTQLASLEGVHILYPYAPKRSLFSFYVEKHHPLDIAIWLAHHKIALRSGSQCAGPLLYYLQQPRGVVRVSYGMYNQLKEIKRLVASLRLFIKAH